MLFESPWPGTFIIAILGRPSLAKGRRSIRPRKERMFCCTRRLDSVLRFHTGFCVHARSSLFNRGQLLVAIGGSPDGTEYSLLVTFNMGGWPSSTNSARQLWAASSVLGSGAAHKSPCNSPGHGRESVIESVLVNAALISNSTLLHSDVSLSGRAISIRIVIRPPSYIRLEW